MNKGRFDNIDLQVKQPVNKQGYVHSCVWRHWFMESYYLSILKKWFFKEGERVLQILLRTTQSKCDSFVGHLLKSLEAIQYKKFSPIIDWTFL